MRVERDFSATTMRVVATAMAISADGREIDVEELLGDLMADYGWSRDVAEEAIHAAQDEGAVWFGPPRGTVLS